MYLSRSDMNKPFAVISFFVFLNVVFGYLFQITIAAHCWLELMIAGGSSFIFWFSLKGQIQKNAARWKTSPNYQYLAGQFGIAFSASLANILLTTSLMFLVVLLSSNCPDAGFQWLNGTFANNLSVHMLCYFSLIFISRENLPTQIDEYPDPAPEVSDHIVLSARNTSYRCKWEDLFFLEASNNCIIIHTRMGKFVQYQSLKSFLEEHAATPIRRVHRSFAVNLDHIRSFEKNKNGDGYLTLDNEMRVKFSRNFFSGLE